MGSDRIDIYRITDFSIPLTILVNEEIEKEIHEDGSRLDVPDLVNEYWLSAHLDDYIIGCYRVHPMGAVMWQVHVRLLPQYRQKHAISASKAALSWIIDNIPNAEKVMCFVPQIHRNVALHASMVGMTKIGTLKRSYLKKGKLIDQDIFAISKLKIINFDNSEVNHASSSSSSSGNRRKFSHAG